MKPGPFLKIAQCIRGVMFLVVLPLHAGTVFSLVPNASPHRSPIDSIAANTWRLTSGLSPCQNLSDRCFTQNRWPCILKGAEWSKQQEKISLPPESLQLVSRLKECFAGEGLPRELAWVAEVESTFRTNAQSASGALGLFQFKPDAARQFGLMAPVDYRTHPDRSARAAARYLAYLHSRMGDWPLAVAAYNAGEGYVWRLLKKEQANTYEAIAMYLPPQTQVYVIKVMATLARRENVALSALPAPIRLNPTLR